LPLPLNLIHEVEIALVELVHTNVTVLTSTGIALAGGVGSDGIEGTEVATHATNLVLKDLVVKTSLELALSGRGGCDIHGGLATTEDDEILLGGNRGAVEGSIGGVRLHDLEVFG